MPRNKQQNNVTFHDFTPSEEESLINSIDDLKDAIELFTTVMIGLQMRRETIQ